MYSLRQQVILLHQQVIFTYANMFLSVYCSSY